MCFKTKIIGSVMTLMLMAPDTLNAAMLPASDYDAASENQSLSVISLGSPTSSRIELASSESVTPANLGTGQVAYESVEFVDGYDYSVVRLDDLTLGTYQLTLTDFAFPEALSQLGVSFSTATDSIGNILLTGGGILQDSITFDITDHDSYYLSVFGRGGSATALGLYGVELKNIVSNVPLPASIVFLLSGLSILSFSWFRNRFQVDR